MHGRVGSTQNNDDGLAQSSSDRRTRKDGRIWFSFHDGGEAFQPKRGLDRNASISDDSAHSFFDEIDTEKKVKESPENVEKDVKEASVEGGDKRKKRNSSVRVSLHAGGGVFQPKTSTVPQDSVHGDSVHSFCGDDSSMPSSPELDGTSARNSPKDGTNATKDTPGSTRKKASRQKEKGAKISLPRIACNADVIFYAGETKQSRIALKIIRFLFSRP